MTLAFAQRTKTALRATASFLMIGALPSVSGNATVRGNTINVDVSVFDIFDFGSSGVELDSLAALAVVRA